MRTKTSKDELGVFIKNGVPVVSSRDIAERFGKEHFHVLRAIHNLECSDEFRQSNFGLSSYTNKQNKYQPEFLITRDGFAFLVMGFSGKEAALFKEKYIASFNNMAESLKYRHNMKISFNPMTDAIQEAHETPQPYHYTNEINMIYRIILGKDAKTYRLEMELDEDADLRDYITNEQKKLVDKFQLTNTGLIIVGMKYKERKELLTNLFSKYQTSIQNKCLMC